MAQRITAKPGNRERGFLTVLVEFYGKAEIIAWVDKNNFWPRPKVDSAIVKIAISDQRLATEINPKSFFCIVQAGFSAKRRQIHNSLMGGLHLPKEKVFNALQKAEIDPTRRAETLTLDEWIRLYKFLKLT
jgi:16S rRNA (adenine1518-N6/adenine1519-N6)-dimethyltransferase